MADGTQAEVDRREDDLLLTEETVGQQPVRAIECPPNFQQTLRRMPPSVAGGTMTVLGRLAAGEPAAFMGAIRLKACPDILRRRVGIDFRLLFRLLSDRVQVVDLIPRQDLERKIKTLVGPAAVAGKAYESASARWATKHPAASKDATGCRGDRAKLKLQINNMRGAERAFGDGDYIVRVRNWRGLAGGEREGAARR